MISSKIKSIKTRAIIIVPLFFLLLTSCGGGIGGSSGSTSAPASVISSSVDFSGKAQLATPSVKTSCFTITASSTPLDPWWISGSFSVTNTCSQGQSANGLQVAILSNNYSLDPNQFQLYSVNGLYFPPPIYWAPSLATFTKSGLINGKTGGVLLSLSTPGILNPSSSAAFSYGYNPAGSQPGSFSYSINGSSPTIESGSIDLQIDGTSLKTICSGTTMCNIPVILNGQNGNFRSTVATITNLNAGNILNVKITGLNSGLYTLSVNSNNLPKTVSFNAAAITVTANTIVNASAAFTVTPLTQGSISYLIVKPTDISLASNLIALNLNNSSGSSVGAQSIAFGQSGSFNNILANSYFLTSYGFADAKTGVYYTPLNLPVTVTAGANTDLGSVSLSKLTNNIVPVTLNIIGLESGDTASIAVVDTNKYNFNSIVAGAGNTALSFINGDNITLNITLNAKYSAINPITVSIASGKVISINAAKNVAPSGQIVGYYETWMATATWESATYSLAQIPGYINIVPLAFAKPDSVYNAGSYNFAGAGLGISATPQVALGAIKLAQAKGQKVLLSVGGATYPNFAQINVPALMALVKDLGVDGIDLDYEADTNGCSNLNTAQLSCPTDTQMINIITQLRTGLDNIRPGMMLTAAVWSIGAYGTPGFPTTKNFPVGSKSALWVNPLKQVGHKFDALFLMSYDAGIYYDSATTTVYPTDGKIYYDPVAALKAYKALYSGPVYQGIEVPPEAWGGNILSPTQAVSLATTAANKGAAGTMIWALQVQGNGYTSNSFLQPICQLYNPGLTSLCSNKIPLN